MNNYQGEAPSNKLGDSEYITLHAAKKAIGKKVYFFVNEKTNDNLFSPPDLQKGTITAIHGALAAEGFYPKSVDILITREDEEIREINIHDFQVFLSFNDVVKYLKESSTKLDLSIKINQLLHEKN